MALMPVYRRPYSHQNARRGGFHLSAVLLPLSWFVCLSTASSTSRSLAYSSLRRGVQAYAPPRQAAPRATTWSVWICEARR
ncbi:hypothetical protein NJL88_28855 [Streptomyces sp. DK15]|nr:MULTISPECIES: hypothetical protein [unclassified Streptomyces]MDA5281248.1 hypothetical protein [Streptomyces sp. Isolate_45]MDX2394004.1 hypothetical protein [Streptomyces sp. DK15]